MEDAHRTYSIDDEFGDLYVGLGVDGTQSKGERMNLVETLKVLQKDVQSYKANNERIMRAKAQQYEFNFKLMQSMEKMEKKMNTETK
jgi:hypothetical protein